MPAEADLLGSCFGWCVCSNSSSEDWHSLFLWNPITLEKITLPPLKKRQSIEYCVLSSPPNESTGCMVMLFTKEFTMIIHCWLGDDEWTELDYFEELKRSLMEAGNWYVRYNNTQSRQRRRLICPVWCNGCLYAMTFYDENLVQIHDFQQPNSLKIKFLNVFLPKAPPYSSYYKFYLVESCGELFTIEIQHLSLKHFVAIEVHRLDFSKMVWLKVNSAKDRKFFVSLEYNWAFSYPAYRPEIEGSRVSFTFFHEGHDYLCSYNIEDKDISISSSPFLNLPTLQSSPIWGIPDLSWLEEQHRGELVHGKVNDLKETNVHGKLNNLKDLEERNDTKELHLTCLPMDLIEQIAQRLFLVDYLHFRATSKMCHYAAPPIQWRISSQRFEKLSLSPWLTLFEKDGACTFIDPKYGDKYFINLPQMLKEGNVICSTKDGWLLLTLGLELSFLFNPFTQVILQLPNMGIRYRNFPCIGFSSAPSSSECVIVDIKKFDIRRILVRFCTVGGNEYNGHIFDTDPNFVFNDNSPIFYRGAFYYLGQKGNLGILKLNDEEHSWKVLTELKQPCTGYIQNFLVECDGELLSVFLDHFGKWVRVFKLNELKMTWMRIESLGNYVLYVSRSSSFSVKATTHGTGNKIYFPRFCGQSIVFYSLETGKYHSIESKDVVDLYCSREKMYCCWIEPTWC
ncbi:f-box/kelch-repeat protein [Fagus crenata]